MFHFFAVFVAVILDKNEECFKFVSHEYVGERVREIERVRVKERVV